MIFFNVFLCHIEPTWQKFYFYDQNCDFFTLFKFKMARQTEIINNDFFSPFTFVLFKRATKQNFSQIFFFLCHIRAYLPKMMSITKTVTFKPP